MDGMQTPPQHELPKPHVSNGEALPDFGKEGFGHVTPELKVAPMPGERLSAANSAVSQAVSAVAVPAMPLQQLQPSTDPQSTTAVIADDNDVIEKEWVDKAKEIVVRTQGDPHAKSNQLTGLKKEYIQQRYGKTIAIPKEDTSKK